MTKLGDLLRELNASSNDAEIIGVFKDISPEQDNFSVEVIQVLLHHYLSLRSQISHASKPDKSVKSDWEHKAKQMERANQMVCKERDRLQGELNKQILLKDKLEDLCRTLQKEKKRIEEESNVRLKLEEAKRKEFAEKVNESITQLKQQINSNQEQQQMLCDENVKLTEQLEKSLEVSKHHEKALEKYEEREQTFTKLLTAKDEERAILSQKYDNAVKLLQEVHQTEIEKFKAQIDELMAQRKTVEESFIEQAKSYDAKFGQMNVLVTESQQTITKYKKEMSEVTKFVSKLHADAVKSKETIQILGKQKVQLEQSNEVLKKKMKALENLCRKLQSDRKTLVHICKNHSLMEEVEKQLAAVENEAPSEGDDPQVSNLTTKLEGQVVLTKLEANGSSESPQVSGDTDSAGKSC